MFRDPLQYPSDNANLKENLLTISNSPVFDNLPFNPLNPLFYDLPRQSATAAKDSQRDTHIISNGLENLKLINSESAINVGKKSSLPNPTKNVNSKTEKENISSARQQNEHIFSESKTTSSKEETAIYKYKSIESHLNEVSSKSHGITNGKLQNDRVKSPMEQAEEINASLSSA